MYRGTEGNLRVGRKANAGNRSDLLEESTDGVLVNVERKVTDEESVALGADGITVTLSTVGSAGGRVGIRRASVGVVKVHGTTLNLMAVHGLVSLGARGAIVEVNVTEATAAASTLLSHDTGVGKTIDVLEDLVEGVVINGPGKATGEEGSGLITLRLLGLGLTIVLSLTLLGGSLLSLLDLSTSLLIGVGAVRVGVRVVVGVVRVIGVGVRLLLELLVKGNVVKSDVLERTFSAALAAGFSSSLSSSESESESESEESSFLAGAAALAAPLTLAALALGFSSSDSLSESEESDLESDSESESESESEDSSFLAGAALALEAFLGAGFSSSEEEESESESEAEASDSESDSDSEEDSSFLLFLDFLESFSLVTFLAAALASSLDLDLEDLEALVTPPALTVLRGSATLAAFLLSFVVDLAIVIMY